MGVNLSDCLSTWFGLGGGTIGMTAYLLILNIYQLSTSCGARRAYDTVM